MRRSARLRFKITCAAAMPMCNSRMTAHGHQIDSGHACSDRWVRLGFKVTCRSHQDSRFNYASVVHQQCTTQRHVGAGMGALQSQDAILRKLYINKTQQKPADKQRHARTCRTCGSGTISGPASKSPMLLLTHSPPGHMRRGPTPISWGLAGPCRWKPTGASCAPASRKRACSALFTCGCVCVGGGGGENITQADGKKRCVRIVRTGWALAHVSEPAQLCSPAGRGVNQTMTSAL
jgi:hypothetical protein